jgi:hypothetical protein
VLKVDSLEIIFHLNSPHSPELWEVRMNLLEFTFRAIEAVLKFTLDGWLRLQDA